VSPGTLVQNNLIHDVDAHNYGGWGIYNDEGSTHILVENNIVYNTKFAGFNINYAKEITVRNNVFAFGRLQQLSRNSAEPHQSVYFENNIVYWKEGMLLDGNWQDKPYKFYFMPDAQSGTKEVAATFEMDYNVYYNPVRTLDSVTFNNNTWAAWQQNGKDVHSLYADPLFFNAAQYDFRLQEHSPALKMGFRQIDVKQVGPRRSRENDTSQ
jgi:parallel beta-helix repeat protein